MNSLHDPTAELLDVPLLVQGISVRKSLVAQSDQLLPPGPGGEGEERSISFRLLEINNPGHPLPRGFWFVREDGGGGGESFCRGGGRVLPCLPGGWLHSAQPAETR